MAPALGGFDPRTPFGDLRGTKPKVPQLFFTLTEEEIVALLMSQGTSEKTAKHDAAKFMKYKDNIVGPKQVWSDDDDDQAGEKPPEEVTRSFAEEIAARKGE